MAGGKYPCPRCGKHTKSRGTGKGRRCSQKDCKHEFTPNENKAKPDLGPGMHIDGNEAQLITELSSERPQLDKVLADWNVDLDIWMVAKHNIGESQVTMKLKQPDKSELPVKSANYNMKVYLVRHKPTMAEWPIVQQGTPVKYKTVKIKLRGGLKRALVYPDPQFGYLINHQTGEKSTIHDETALSVVSNVLKKMQPDEVIGLGDLLDFSEQTTHFVRKPEFFFQTQSALDRVVKWFADNRGYTGRWREIPGNHDKRLGQNIMENAINAWGLRPGTLPDKEPEEVCMSVDFLTRMSEFNIEYLDEYPHGVARINKNLVCIHGEKIGSKPGQTVMKNLERPRESVICGHIHRVESGHTTTHHIEGQRTHGFYSPGCLCKIDGTTPGKTSRPDWQNGFAVVDFDEEFFHVDLIPILGDTCIFGGKKYEADK